jgi:plasmid stabilization system protein ParE
VQVEFSRFVEPDLEAVGDYIAQDSPSRALAFIREVRQKINQVAQQPLLYQLRPEIGEGARLAVIRRYVILFRVIGETVRIERILYGGRDLPALFQ